MRTASAGVGPHAVPPERPERDQRLDSTTQQPRAPVEVPHTPAGGDRHRLDSDSTCMIAACTVMHRIAGQPTRGQPEAPHRRPRSASPMGRARRHASTRTPRAACRRMGRQQLCASDGASPVARQCARTVRPTACIAVFPSPTSSGSPYRPATFARRRLRDARVGASVRATGARYARPAPCETSSSSEAPHCGS